MSLRPVQHMIDLIPIQHAHDPAFRVGYQEQSILITLEVMKCIRQCRFRGQYALNRFGHIGHRQAAMAAGDALQQIFGPDIGRDLMVLIHDREMCFQAMLQGMDRLLDRGMLRQGGKAASGHLAHRELSVKMLALDHLQFLGGHEVDKQADEPEK